MAEDRTTTEYHLTPEGWVQGDYYYFNKLQGEKKQVPEDRIETWNFETKQQSGWSREQRWATIAWRSESLSKQEREAIRARHPVPWPQPLTE